jgi:hypothetical protein
VTLVTPELPAKSGQVVMVAVPGDFAGATIYSALIFAARMTLAHFSV